jgi:DNA-binding response OmpR family regulator/HPt (histidine-containing phosphotransfer) domain-containing protein
VRTSTILLAGLPTGIAAPIADRFRGASVQLAFTGEEAIATLEGGGCRLLVIDDALPGLPAAEVMRWARTQPALEGLRSVYCVDLGARSENAEAELDRILARLAPDRILVHPLDRAELVRQVARLLDDPDPPPAPPLAAAPAPLADAVAKLWERSRPAILERVAAVERAAAAARAGELRGPERHAAEREAHRLAGALGTFGYPRGSEIAFGMERLLAGGTRLTPADGAALADGAAELRALLARPPAAAPPPSAPAEPAAPQERPRVLVVDDDPAVGAVLREAGARRGLEVAVVESPAAARAWTAAHRPAALLLDLSFPEGEDDGVAFLAEVAAAHPDLPVLVSTARNTTFDRVRVLHHGARGFLRKPYDPARALAMVARHLKGPDPLDGSTVLAVDDDPTLLAALETMLAPHGVRVHTLSNPLRFWSRLEAAAPDLVILDADMPHLDGIELCRLLRSDLHRGDLPVLFLTARTDAGTVERVFAAGADDFVPKPVLGPELVGRIRNRLERAGRRGGPPPVDGPAADGGR